MMSSMRWIEVPSPRARDGVTPERSSGHQMPDSLDNIWTSTAAHGYMRWALPEEPEIYSWDVENVWWQ